MVQPIELSKVKEEIQQEKQLLVEIYKMAFEQFLSNVFTTKFLRTRIKEEIECDKNVLNYKISKDKSGATITNFNFRDMVADLFFNKGLMILGIAFVKSKFKNYKKIIKENFIYDYSKLTLNEIKNLVIDPNLTWQLILKNLEDEGIEYEFFEREDCLVLKLNF
ncbi:hypothetical protein NQ113_24565 [Bacillus pseudomycoides]|uniref:hypothetical protein n=1 Tax=Bacillus pseudomycoides TaxID=64104 RepID=UPI00215A81B7|nr:hypothetical protein [Bacillus pseudomycoides]MCR8860347.1 hypothetical protein [Bacillus pseudomycoides]